MIKPGCFGMGLVHKANPTCMMCKKQTECRKQSLLTLSEIHRTMDCSDLLMHYEDIKEAPHESSKATVVRKKGAVTTRVQMTEEQQRMVDGLPVKPRKIATTLFGRGIDLKESLSRRVVPFDSFMRVPCYMLMEKGFTKKELKAALMAEHRHWTERTAEGQLSVAFALLNGLDCLTHNNGRYRLKEY